jgi:excisionase family DNA binding protein
VRKRLEQNDPSELPIHSTHVGTRRRVAEYPLFIVYERNSRYIHSPDFTEVEPIENGPDPHEEIIKALAKIHRKMAAALTEDLSSEGKSPSVTCLKASEEEKLLTTTEAATYLGISDSSLQRLHRNGKISARSTPGGHRRFAINALAQYKRLNEQSP